MTDEHRFVLQASAGVVQLACYALNATRPRFDTSAVCRPCVVNVECMCFHVLMDMPVPQACRERPTSLRFTTSHRRIAASSNCLIAASPSSYCLIVKGSRGVGEQFCRCWFRFRSSVGLRSAGSLSRRRGSDAHPLLHRFSTPPLLHQPRYLSAPPTPQNAAASSLVFGVFLLFGRVGRLPRLVAWSFGGCVVLCVLRSGGAALLLRELRCCAAVRPSCCGVVLLRRSVLACGVCVVCGPCVGCLCV